MDEEFVSCEENPGSALVREVFDWIESAIMALVCVILVFTFIGRQVGVSGDSMINTLNDQDRLVAVTFMYKPKNGDIVVATKPNLRNEPLIKRVIAVGGQTIDINRETGEILVDGVVIEEDYIREPMDPRSTGDMDYPVAVPPGYVFLMGDNRNYSWDSRYQGVGLIDERHILGKAVYRIMPYKNMGGLYK
ncbi:MAG: signal peptidase I [Oscillospiraceae bacterium]|nr:signal peptidase I [Oscillospiraceae bacterium]